MRMSFGLRITYTLWEWGLTQALTLKIFHTRQRYFLGIMVLNNCLLWFRSIALQIIHSPSPLHSVLRTSKNWTDWKSTTLLRSVREVISQVNCTSNIGETGGYRGSQFTGAEIPTGTSAGAEKIWTIINEFREAQCEQVWRLKTSGGPRHIRWEGAHTSVFYLQ